MPYLDYWDDDGGWYGCVLESSVIGGVVCRGGAKWLKAMAYSAASLLPPIPLITQTSLRFFFFQKHPTLHFQPF